MCSGDRVLADFVIGPGARPNLPEVLQEHLTPTTDGQWVVWAYKAARQNGDVFASLSGRSIYPVDAKATCLIQGVQGGHDAPDPDCTCGFHALSSRNLLGPMAGHRFSMLEVALSGRVLAFDWVSGGVLWRAQRQTVVRVERPSQSDWTEIDWTQQAGVPGRHLPDDPDGRLAIVRPEVPRDSGPIRLSLPVSAPVLQLCNDDPGWCVGNRAIERAPSALVLA